MDPKALYKVSYGIYIVSSKKGDKINGQIANTVFQITAEPPTFAISINKQNLTYEYISESKVFTVSVLDQATPMELIGRFGFKSGRDLNKFANIQYKLGKTGAPLVLDNALAYLEAEVINRIDCGTHTVFLGKILEAEVLKEGEPMTYAYYHEVKKGFSPKTAPTYIKAEKSKEASEVKKFRCTVCGYIYDPEQGDPDSGIKPGTSFEALPADWVCPVCGVGKDKFEPAD